jgi:hypothetical protein
MMLRRHIHQGQPRSRDAGDTLVELLVALAIISICVIGLIGGLTSAIASSGTHRNLTNLDNAIKDFTELVRYDVQLQPNSPASTPPTAPLFARCASTYLLAGTPNPSSGPVGTAVTAFGSGFSGAGSSVTIGTTTFSNAVTPTGNGNVRANFTVPPLPAGTYPITINGGGTATSTTGYTVTPWLGGLSASSGPANTPVTVRARGFAANRSLTVTVGSSSPVVGGSTNSTGSTPPGAPVSFNIPTGLSGPQTVIISDGTNSATTKFTVGGTAAGLPGVGGTIVSTSPLANYAVGISAINYWNGGSFTATQAQCQSTSSPNNDLQQIIISGTAPGASDQLNTVVSNPQFVPTPSVTVQQDPNSNPSVGGALILDAVIQAPSPTSPAPGAGATVTWEIDVAGIPLAPTCAGPNQLNQNPDPTLPSPASGSSTTAQCVIFGSNLTANNYTITAVYNGNSNYNSASGTYHVTIPKGNQTISVPPVSAPPYGQPLTFTAIVSVPQTGPAPQGTVTWPLVTLNGAPVTCATTALTSTSPYTATCTIAHVTVGTYQAQAAISPDANYNGNQSTVQSVTINPLLATTSVTASPSTQTVGGTIQFTATVTGSGPPSLAGTVTWTGVTCNSSTFNTSGTTGTAVCNVTAGTVGTYTATANYGGDPLYAPSSGSKSVVVSRATPAVTVNGAAANGSITFTATVAGPGGGAYPTGSGTWTVAGPGVSTCTGGTTTLTGTGNPQGTATATCVISQANAGTYTASYSYNGDTNYNPGNGSTSYSVNQVTPTVVITASMHNHKLTFTSTVTGTAGGPTPTGTSTWTVSGPVSSCSGGSTPLSGSGNPQGTATATCVISSPAPAGTYTMTHSYGGDSNYNAATGSASFHIPSLVVTGTSTGSGNNGTVTFTATLNISPAVPAPNGNISWSVSGSATSCSATTPLAGSGTTYTATCVINGTKNSQTFNGTASFAGDTYYLPADDTLTGVGG